MLSFFKNLSFDRALFVSAFALFSLSFPMSLFHADYPNLSFIERPRPGFHLTERIMDAAGFPREVVLDEMRFLNISVRSPSVQEKAASPAREWNLSLMERPFLQPAPPPQHVKRVAGPTAPKKEKRLVQTGGTVGNKWLFVGLVQTEWKGEVKVVLKDIKSNRHHLLNKGEGIDGLKVEEVVFHTAILVSEDGQRWTLTTRPGESKLFIEGGR